MKIVLAPMEGVVDWIMRDLLTQIGGIDWCLTEFIRVTTQRLPKSEFFKYCPELKTGARTRAGVPVYVQLLGGQPDPLAENAQVAIDLGAPGIDLNFGCPAKTVNRHDGGASLLREPSRIEKIVSAVREVVPASFPVSAKVRLGFDHKVDFLEIARAAENGGASWLTVHARTKADGYRPPAYWEYITQIRETLRIPVIANGEIWNEADFERCREVTGCDWFMMGRGLIAKPDLALRICGRAPLSVAQVRQWLCWFFQVSLEHGGERFAVCRTKQWCKFLGRDDGFFRDLFEQIKILQTAAEMELALEGCFAVPDRGRINFLRGEGYGQSAHLYQR